VLFRSTEAADVRAQLIAILPVTTASTRHKHEADRHGSCNDKKRVRHGF
jgi:hypothetical protein